MSPIPNKGFFDPEPMDSVKHNEERAAKIKVEAKEQQLTQEATENKQMHDQAKRAREQEIEYLTVQVGLIRPGETRDMLLERIRRMREVTVEEPKYIGRSPELQKQFEKEQEDGRAAVAKAEAEQVRLRELQARVDAEDQALVLQVHRPNPGMDEIFPTSKATLPGSSPSMRKK